MSALLEKIRPDGTQSVMDLVRAAGVDVSDWKNSKRGEAGASANPKYCYEWAFVQPGKVVVMNLWFDEMKVQGGVIFQEINLRAPLVEGSSQKKAMWKSRASSSEAAVKNAFENNLPIRIIVGEGIRRDLSNPNSKASQVKKRKLDAVPWAVTAYDPRTGDFTLTRGALPLRFVDQFDIQGGGVFPDRRPVSGYAYTRSAEVRDRVLRRSNGKCEWCLKDGFLSEKGSIYLETHHVVPLSEEGQDSEKNVVALCPNHHLEAHFGAEKIVMKQKLQKFLEDIWRVKRTVP